MAARSKAWVYGHSLAGISGSIPGGAWSSVSCEFYDVQRSPTEFGVSECDREASTMRTPLPSRGCRAMKKYNLQVPNTAQSIIFSRKEK